MKEAIPYTRNGTSQNTRALAALDPDHFQMDERSIEDLLRFAQRLGATLHYFNADNQIEGDWAAFLAGNPAEMAAFLQDPAAFDHLAKKQERFSRPHLTLLLTFLKLLQGVQAEINQLTRRQLDFYFQTALGFVKQPAVPDEVHVLAQLGPKVSEGLIPKGSLLLAGKDEAGKPVHYQTDEDLLANQVQIARLMSLHVDKEVWDIPMLRFLGEKEAWEDRGYEAIMGLIQAIFEAVREEQRTTAIAAAVAAGRKEEEVAAELDQQDEWKQLDTEAAFQQMQMVTEFLEMPVSLFLRIMAEYRQWQAEAHWQAQTGDPPGLNDHLLTFYQLRADHIPNHNPLTDDVRDFDANFFAALGFTVEGEKNDGSNENVFHDLTGVQDLYDLYDRYRRYTGAEDAEIQAFIVQSFGELDRFETFMKLRMQGLQSIRRLQDVLRQAAARKDPLSPPQFHGFLDYRSNQTLTDTIEAILELDQAVWDRIYEGSAPDWNDAYLMEAEANFRVLEAGMHFGLDDLLFIQGLYQYRSSTSEVPDWKWARADRLLEGVYASFYQQLSPESQELWPATPQKVRWRNLYQAPDATRLTVPALRPEQSHPRWRTFGAHPPEETDPEAYLAAVLGRTLASSSLKVAPEDLFESNIGWAIYSPALRLSEGTRTLTLGLSFEATGVAYLQSHYAHFLPEWNGEEDSTDPPFRLEVSTEAGWLEVPDWDEFSIWDEEPVIKLTVSLSAEADPLAPVAEETYRHAYPGVRLLLNKQPLSFTDLETNLTETISFYEVFKGLRLEKVEVAISVSGLTDLQLQTPRGMQKPKKPFAPFGDTPAIGDRLYLTHPELAQQQLDSVSIALEWKTLPGETGDDKPLESYYEPYGSLTNQLEGVDPLTILQADFQARLHLIEPFRQMPLTSDDPIHLFADSGTTSSLNVTSIPSTYPPSNLPYELLFAPNLGREVTDSDRYLALELINQDFLHDTYRELLNEQRAQLNRQAVRAMRDEDRADALSKMEDLSIALPEPYTPILASIRVDYSTSFSINWMEQTASPEALAVQVEPFGEAPLPPAGQAVSFLPNLEAAGNLYIGLENLTPPQNVSFLFQMAEGSANPEWLPSPLEWSYLSGNRWKTFSDRELLREETHGLLTSGLVKLHFPADASNDSLRMPADLHWVRIQVKERPDSLSDCIAIHTQALSATWVPKGNSGLHLAQALPPETIQKPAESIGGLKALWQPYASFHGKAAEGDAGWYSRVSERLRHKDRALTLWDYERITLGYFPDVYRAKALPADLFQQGDPPGTVRVIVIPDVRQRPSFDPFEPRVPIARIQEIQAVLQAHAPPFARVVVQNPRFLHLRVRVAVRFYDMNNFGYYAEQLDREIQGFLSPWAFDHTEEISFGGKIHPSVLVHFIENRPYVDYLEEPEFRLMQKELDGVLRVMEHQPLDDEGLLDVREPDTLIVSANWHILEYLPAPGEGPVRIRRGIGYDLIEFDFTVT